MYTYKVDMAENLAIQQKIITAYTSVTPDDRKKRAQRYSRVKPDRNGFAKTMMMAVHLTNRDISQVCMYSILNVIEFFFFQQGWGVEADWGTLRDVCQ